LCLAKDSAGTGRAAQPWSARPAHGDQSIEEPAELAFVVHVAVGAPDDPEGTIWRQPGPDAAARSPERDEDAGDEAGERDPDDPLAGIALGDQQRVLADVGQADRQVEVLRDLRVAALELDGLVGLRDRLAVGGGPADPVRQRDQDTGAVLGLVEEEL
jgi:hypothetical protein